MGLLGLGISTLVFAVLGFAILGGPVVYRLEPIVAAGGIASIVLGAIVRSLASRHSTR
jgi:hypothetical protein